MCLAVSAMSNITQHKTNWFVIAEPNVELTLCETAYCNTEHTNEAGLLLCQESKVPLTLVTQALCAGIAS